ncbi:hypothetical protein ACFPRL_21135 [Pseudoclavibacter helvolus]
MPGVGAGRPRPHREGIDAEQLLRAKQQGDVAGHVVVDGLQLVSPADPVEGRTARAARLVDDRAHGVDLAAPAALVLRVALDVVVLARLRVARELPPAESEVVLVQPALVGGHVEIRALADHPRVELREVAHRGHVVAGGPAPDGRMQVVQVVGLRERARPEPQERLPQLGCTPQAGRSGRNFAARSRLPYTDLLSHVAPPLTSSLKCAHS